MRTAATISFVVALGFGVIAPALPILAEEFGAGNILVGMAISAMAGMRFASAMVNGRLVTRFGERAVLKWGLILQGVTTIGAGLAPNFELLVIYRAIGGIGSSAFSIAALALVLRLAPPEARGRSVGMFQTGFMLGAIAGPGIGGVLADVNGRFPFFLYGVMLFIAAGIGHAFLPMPSQLRSDPHLHVPEEPDGMPSKPVEVARAEHPRPSSPVHDAAARRRLFLLAMVAIVLVNFGNGWIGYGLRNSLIPVFATVELGLSATMVGLALLSTAVVQLLLVRQVGSLSDRRGRRPLMVGGAALSVVSMALLILPPATHWFLAAMVVMGVASSALTSAPAAVLADISDSGAAAGNVARFNMSSDFGAIVGPIVAGAVADAANYQMAFVVSAAVLVAGLLMTLCMEETNPPTRPA